MFDKVKQTLGNTKNLIFIVIAILFIITAVVVYKKFVSPRLNPDFVANKEWIGKNNTNNSSSLDGPQEAEVYFFFTEWCPHCKKAEPIWQQFKEQNEGKIINNYKLIFRDIDADKDEATANLFDVQAFPTIKLKKNQEIIEYDAKPQVSTLNKFVNTVL